ncbi:MAG: hypothetical protein HOW73_48830 [Polyangiaceae bacterium]|nr:hypothetical protein [Polyangiaceae bacterium]
MVLGKAATASALDCNDDGSVLAEAQRGIRAYSGEKYEEAVDPLTAAYECTHERALLLILARTHARLGQRESALARLRELEQKAADQPDGEKADIAELRQEIAPEIEVAEAPWSPSPIFWSGIAAAGIGTVLAIVGGAVSASQTSSLESECNGSSCPSRLSDDVEEANRWANVANGGFVGIGVGGVLIIVGAIIGPFPTTTRLVALPGGGGLAVRF